MNWRALGATALAVALTVPFALPFAYLLVRNGQDLGGLWSALSDDRLVGPLLRSLALGISVALAAAVLGTSAAWLVARALCWWPGPGLLGHRDRCLHGLGLGV